MSYESPQIINFPTFKNTSSVLSAGEYDEHIPFKIKRFYWSYANIEANQRGNHYHPHSKRIIICLNGNIEVNIENQKGEVNTYYLTSPDQGLFIPENHWISMKTNKDAIMLAIASTKFEEGESINDYSKFEALKNG